MVKRIPRPEAEPGQSAPESHGPSGAERDDARPAGEPMDATAPAESPGGTPDAPTSPSLIWPPPDDELNGWEVLQLNSSGHTVIEPMRYTPPAPGGATASGSRPRPDPNSYVPPQPPAPAPPADAWPSRDTDASLPETELIEPLPPEARIRAVPSSGSSHPGPSKPGQSSSGSPSWPAVPSRPSLVHKREPDPDPDDTNPGLMTRILPVPDFARRPPPAPAPPPPTPEARRSLEDTQPIRVPRPDPASGTMPRTWHREDASSGVVRPSGPGFGDAGADAPPAGYSSRPSQPAVPAGGSAGHAGWPAPSADPPPRVEYSPPAPAPYVPAVPETHPTAQPEASSAVPPFDAGRDRRQHFWALALWLLAIAAAVLLGFLAFRTLSPAAAADAPAASLVIDSTPAGADVLIDGQVLGKTPFRGEVAAGTHDIELRSGEERRQQRVTLQAGTLTSHAFDFAPAAAATADAALDVRSDPSGARVTIGGIARGVTPVVVKGLTAGKHQVQVGGPFRPVTRTVTLAAGQQALLVITPARTTPEPSAAEAAEPPRAARGNGYLSVQSPILLRVLRNGEYLGTSEDTRVTVPVGTQVIGLENESVGFREVRSVDVLPGRTVVVTVEVPQGTLNINARPWAEVFVDGRRVGETPVAQLALSIGVHEIVFRHPTHGERRVTALVKVGAPGRAFVDFTR